MSLKRRCYHTISTANNHLGGARASKAARTRHGEAFVDFCLLKHYPISDIRRIQVEWLKSWIEDLKMSTNCAATIANKVSSVRKLSQPRGCAGAKENGVFSSQEIGLEKRSRIGRKSPITDQLFDIAIESALKLGEEGFAHVLRLERFLGLRGLEALMSTHALKVFASQAKALMTLGSDTVHIRDGTKGGRPRDVAVIKKYARETYEAIIGALHFAKSNNGFLIVGKTSSGLKEARLKYHRLASKVGLTGEFAPHSLRYRYCTDKLIELRDAGYPRGEALAFASLCLGHGPSRGRFVSSVYGKTVTHLLPKSTRLQNINDLIKWLEQFPQDLSNGFNQIDAP